MNSTILFLEEMQTGDDQVDSEPVALKDEDFPSLYGRVITHNDMHSILVDSKSKPSFSCIEF